MPMDPLEDSLPDLPVEGFTLTCLHLCRQKLSQVVPTSVNLLCTSEVQPSQAYSILEWTRDLTFKCFLRCSRATVCRLMLPSV